MDEMSPTRTNLLTRRSQLELARRGVELLEKKRDALVKKFSADVHEALEARRQLYQASQAAHLALILAKSFDGPAAVEILSLEMPVRCTAQAEVMNVWGARVPRLAIDDGYAATMSPLMVGGRTIGAQDAFHQLCRLLIQSANSEARLRSLAEEIKKTARRVNALQQTIIPGISLQIRSIQQALDQQEQEDIFRLKRIKGKLHTHHPQ
jgi:V/A-type H+/Na+-transporting ATPase subunit D